jgi:hypothetical protein
MAADRVHPDSTVIIDISHPNRINISVYVTKINLVTVILGIICLLVLLVSWFAVIAPVFLFWVGGIRSSLFAVIALVFLFWVCGILPSLFVVIALVILFWVCGILSSLFAVIELVF